jgi:peroxiredoxin
MRYNDGYTRKGTIDQSNKQANLRKTMSHTDQPHWPILEKGHIIPTFTLPGTDGMPHSPWDYKQREHLLLLFINSTKTGEAHDLLRSYAQYYADFREEQCSLLVISSDTVFINLQTQEELHLPFALVSDAQGNTIKRYTQWEEATRTCLPGIVLADRYNALYEQKIVDNIAGLPTIQDTLESLRYLNRICTP